MNPTENTLTKKLGIKFPLILAPMAGGPSSVDLVATASNSGALGSIGGAYLNPSALESFILAVQKKTQNNFSVNLFIPSKPVNITADRIHRAINGTEQVRAELSLPPPKISAPYEENFDKQFEIIIKYKPKVFSFVFGTLDELYTKELKKLGIFIVGTATTPAEALELAESGVDAIVAQGVDSGGHRGIFDDSAEDPNIKTVALIKAIQQKTKIPLIGAAGIMNSDDIKRTLQAGAEAVQMGTAFLATKEAGTSVPYRRKLLEAPTRTTRLTRAFSGRLARGIVNRFMEEMDSQSQVILPFPIQNSFTRDIRTASTNKDLSDFLSLWAGTGQGELWTGSARDLIHNLFVGTSKQ